MVEKLGILVVYQEGIGQWHMDVDHKAEEPHVSMYSDTDTWKTVCTRQDLDQGHSTHAYTCICTHKYTKIVICSISWITWKYSFRPDMHVEQQISMEGLNCVCVYIYVCVWNTCF